MTSNKSQPLWTPVFVLLCLAQFLGYAQHAILQPTLPIYATNLGATPFIVGVVLASFAITSMVLRPFVGYWSDRWSELGVMVCGVAIQGASVSLCFIPMVTAILLSNGCRGIGWACFNSGGYAILAHCAPAARRGEASGYYSGVQGSAVILLPALALWLIDAPFAGFHAVFFAQCSKSFNIDNAQMRIGGRFADQQPSARIDQCFHCLIVAGGHLMSLDAKPR